MIMKNGKQIGFIYKNGKKIDKIIRHGKVYFEQGFTRELTSTTLPVSFNGIGKDLKDYKIYGNTKQQLLPDGYTQVDYIESDDNSWIDMGIKGNQNTRIITSIIAKNGSTFIGSLADSSQAITLRFMRNNSSSISRFGNKSVEGIFTNYSYNTRYLIETSSDGIIVDNVRIHEWGEIDDFETVGNLFLFKNDTAANSIRADIYYCKVYENNVLVRDYIPCYRNSDNEVGLYDLVNNVFYTNQGTGVFTYGSVVPTPDAPIEMVSCGDLITDISDINYGKYKIPINIKSDNLLNNTLQSQTKNGIILTKNSDGSVTANGTATTNTFFDIGKFVQKQGIAYTLNGCPKGGGNSKYRLYILGETNLYFDNGNGINFPIIDTDTERTVRLAIYNGMTVKDLTFYPMIKLTEKGNIKYQLYYNETTNIYLDEPLRKIDEYSDYIDFKNNKIIRNIDEIILNGNENWADSKIARDILTHRFKTLGTKSHIVDIGISNKFIVKDSEMDIYNDVEMVQLASSTSNTYIGLKIYISRLSTNDVSGLMNWLSSNPITLDYVLLTPTEESITLPNIPTIDGNNTLNIETEITPSQIYIKYKSNN